MSRGDQFQLRWRGRVTGPFTWAEIERKLDAHEIGLLHDLQHGAGWITLGEYSAGRADAVRVTPNVPVAAPPSGADLRANSVATPLSANSHGPTRVPNRWVFIGLGFVFGFLGAHDFYAHHWIRGALLLGITALLWALDWGIIWPWLWAIGEIILLKVDGKGRRMPWKTPPKSHPETSTPNS
jgi:TM2 domain-containing membrane protein YozV